MKIAIMGTRGVPPRYGGFETFAAELGTRLVARGHHVSVYCRESGEPNWNGIERLVVPSLAGHKYLETVSHTFFSALDSLRRGFDVVLLCNAANAFVLPLLRSARIPVAINVDGIERNRRKWNFLGRAVYTIGESFSALFANRIVADADVIADYYRAQWGAESTMIPYGADFPDEPDSDVLERLGLQPRGYVLYVSRFEPENNPLEVVEAYGRLLSEWPVTSGQWPAPPTQSGAASSTGHWSLVTGHSAPPPLVMLGKGLYAPDLVAELHRHAGPQILFPGALYGADYRTLQRNALVYVQATEVGGTHPAMIEAMASGGCVLAHDTPENREVGGDAVGYFRLRPTETLSGTLRECVSDAVAREELRARGRRRSRGRYGWEAVTDSYEELFRSLTP